ncbi:GTP-binding protein EngA [Plesiocystis pacifica SIR-1]|uniref:GTPase Der n=1 Tax=Plesiocystis pacifica SIR-1 TaxID=391625 RepID=A6GFF8_9BACT|nr:ribosome biogenesis GTPase Der [Plesiocystis pacifica]EDM75385.1 GTP-binding protein EngA [Plesiocystis pacifica SIR-1]
MSEIEFEGETVELSADDDPRGASAASAPLVAIIGRPNVGKSTLFNRLVGRREAIVEDRPGVTRDRLYGVASWEGRHFLVVDTGGVDPSLDTGLPGHIRSQAEVAMEEADLILFVVDAKEGATAVDIDIAAELRRSGKPVMLAANKADSPSRELAAAAMHELGLGEVHAVSAAHGRGVGDFCDALLERLPAATEAQPTPIPPGTRIAFIGRPNAGKSTLVNTLLEEQRVIVSDTPGTTRDPVYLPFRYKDRDLVLTDTAGLRRRKQIARAMEKLAAIKSIRTMERTQVVVLVIDASQGVTDQDQRLARMAFERGKGVVVALHKWDLIRRDGKLAKDTLAYTQEALGFLENPYIIKSSVIGEGRDEGKGRAFNLAELLDACLSTAAALGKRIPTSALNEELQGAVADHSPPMYRAKSVRLYFATQAENEPPLIVISANHGRCLSPAYERYLLRRIRRRWHLRGVPVRLVVRGRGRGNKDRGKERSGKKK